MNPASPDDPAATGTTPPPSPEPEPVTVWLWRVWVVVVLGIVVATTVLNLRSGTLAPPYDTLALVLLLYALGAGALAWWLAAAPSPDGQVWAALRQPLGRRERYRIGRALLRGTGIAPQHRDYAVARVARQRRALLTLGPVSALVWSQVVSVAGSEAGPGPVRFVLAAAVVVAVVTAGSLVLQCRRERTLRRVLSDPRRS